MPMSPEEAITRLPDLITECGNRLAVIAQGAAAAKSQWEALGRVGGQRSDHAADILCGNLRNPISEMEDFLTRVRHQINLMLADPFSHKGGKVNA